MTDNSKHTGAAIEAHYRFLMWLTPTVQKFPRSHKFTIGDRIEALALDVLEALIEAIYTRDRASARLVARPGEIEQAVACLRALSEWRSDREGGRNLKTAKALASTFQQPYLRAPMR